MRPVFALGIATIIVMASAIVAPPEAEAKHGWKHGNGNKHYWKQQRKFNRFAMGRTCGNGPPPWAAVNNFNQGWGGPGNNWNNNWNNNCNGGFNNMGYYGNPYGNSLARDLRWQFLGF